MSGVRRLYLDAGVGEARAVVTLDGLPERLWLRRDGDPTPRLGAVYSARVLQVSPRMGLARLDLGDGLAGSLRLSGEASAHEGQMLSVEVVAEPRQDKPAGLGLVDPSPPARPGLLARPPGLDVVLRGFCGATEIVTGERAREVADLAQIAALAKTSATGGGAVLTVEPTRALVAVDVDFAEQGLAGSIAAANREAIADAARLLRLKSLGGLAAIDLIGFPKDRRRLQAAAEAAFAPDGPQVAIEAPGRFGLLLVSRPHREQPIHEQLREPSGAMSLPAAVGQVIRAMQRQGRFAPGARIVADCPPDLAQAAGASVRALGPRFSIQAHPGASRENPDIRAL